jgi:hypothetical protein
MGSGGADDGAGSGKENRAGAGAEDRADAGTWCGRGRRDTPARGDDLECALADVAAVLQAQQAAAPAAGVPAAGPAGGQPLGAAAGGAQQQPGAGAGCCDVARLNKDQDQDQGAPGAAGKAAAASHQLLPGPGGPYCKPLQTQLQQLQAAAAASLLPSLGATLGAEGASAAATPADRLLRSALVSPLMLAQAEAVAAATAGGSGAREWGGGSSCGEGMAGRRSGSKGPLTPNELRGRVNAFRMQVGRGDGAAWKGGEGQAQGG